MINFTTRESSICGRTTVAAMETGILPYTKT